MSQITFPPQGQWIPDLERISNTGTVLLEVAGGALDYYGRGEPYTRRVIQHGTGSPVVLGGTGNLICRWAGAFTGKAGQSQFQFADGAIGRLGFRFLRYVFTISRPWPKPEGGMRARLADSADVDESEVQLTQDGLVVFDAMRALALGGVKAPNMPAVRQVLPTALEPTPVRGGMGGAQLTVEVMFD